MGLDIEVYSLRKVDQSKKWTSEEIEESFPSDDICVFDEEKIDGIPGADKFVFDIDQKVIKYDKLVENTSTPEHPRKWSDGWQWGGTCSRPWDDNVPLDENAHGYIHFVRYDPDPEKKDDHGCRVKLDEVWIPMTEDVVNKAIGRQDYKAILHGPGHGYQRKGMKSEFYDYMGKRGCYWVFTLEELKTIQQMAENPDEFKENILDAFEEGKDVVWFWYQDWYES